MADGINGGDDTDRLLVRWDLARPAVGAACAARPAPPTRGRAGGGAAVALGSHAAGGPSPGAVDAAGALVAVPTTSRRCARTDPALARRLAGRRPRRRSAGCWPTAAASTGFDRDGGTSYVAARRASR